ncbi:hypothetical protein RCL1_004149 [Eukaryota sp. TZLM3-RCL]
MFSQVLDLRFRVLREPLNMPRGSEHNKLDTDSIHFGLFCFNKLVACLSLCTSGINRGKLFQMGVHQEHQSSGFGSQILLFCLNYAKENSFSHVFLHGRHHATGFYKKFGFEVEGDSFEEVGIKHFKMIVKID